jgi:hypothetical protein
MRKVAMDNEPIAKALLQRQKEGIFDSEQSLLDFEEYLEEDDMKGIDRTTKERVNLMMFPTSWREARVDRDQLYLAHAMDNGIRPLEITDIDMSKEEDFEKVHEAI